MRPKFPLPIVALALGLLALAVGYGWLARERGWDWPMDAVPPQGPGGMQLVVKFPEGGAPGVEPLLVLGAGGSQEALLIEYSRSGRGRLVYAAADGLRVTGREFELQPGRARWIEVHAPVLYPPKAAAWYRRQPAGASALAGHVLARVDGRVVLDRDWPEAEDGGSRMAAFGRRAGFPAGRETFGGLVRRVRGISADPAWLAQRAAEGGVLYLTADTAALRVGEAAPLAATRGAAAGSGVMLMATRPAAGRLKFELWREQADRPEAAAELAWSGDRALALQLALSSLPLASADGTGRVAEARLAVEGRVVLQAPLDLPPVSRDQVRIGARAWLVPNVAAVWPGEIAGESWGDDADVARRRAFDALLAGREMEIEWELAGPPPGSAQPLLCLGSPGRADSVFVEFLPGNRVRLGLDHWGAQPIVSEAVPLGNGVRHRVRLSFGVRLEGEGEAAGRLRVWLDDKPVLDGPARFFPCPPEQIHVGANPVGMSTSAPAFSGKIVRFDAARGEAR